MFFIAQAWNKNWLMRTLAELKWWWGSVAGDGDWRGYLRIKRMVSRCGLLAVLLFGWPGVGRAQFEFVVTNGTITITKYVSPIVGPVVIPDSIQGVEVTAIGKQSFTYCTNVTSVVMGSTITNIGDNAFMLCTRMTNLVIGPNVRGIGMETFANCSGLTALAIPDGVVDIGFAAFGGCRNLTNITISSSLKDIGMSMFEGCSSLPDIFIPGSVTNIGDQVFFDCQKLKVINVDPTNSTYSSLNGVLFDRKQNLLLAFPEGHGTNYVIPDTVNTIGPDAFADCTNLVRVTIPDSVTNIISPAFENCSALEELRIPNGVTEIGAGVFQGCYRLTNIVISSGFTNIQPAVFLGLVNLQTYSVEAGNPLFSSIDGVLFNQSGTVLLDFPVGRQGTYIMPEGVRAIGNNAFSDCTELTNINIPNGVVVIGTNAFSGCARLTAVTIPGTVQDIQDSAFWNCGGLRDVVFLDGVKIIERNAFGGCFGLSKVNLPDSVTSIGEGAFAGCYYLTNVVVGNGVSSIGDNAFGNCDSLRSVYMRGNAPAIHTSVINNGSTPNGVKIYYLPGTTGWAQFLLTNGSKGFLWSLANPLILNQNSNFGVKSNGFGFTVSWATNATIVVEASTSLAEPVWVPVATNALVSGTNYYSDPEWRNYPGRYYRVRTP